MRIKYETILEAKTPIFHGGDEKTGNTPILRTITLYDSTLDKFFVLPYISGNAIRGKLRRLIIHDLFERLNYEPNLKMHHIFYSGGVLESSSDVYGYVDLELRKKVRETLIPLSLFGFSISNQIFTGKLQVGHAFPICSEYKNFLPEHFKNNSRIEKSVRSFTDDTFITRKAEIIEPRDADEQAVQMKVNYECFIPGTQFYHWFSLDTPNELEKSCFGHLIELFRQTPFVGGRSAQGDGEVEIKFINEIPKNDLYLNFVNENKEKILQTIKELELISTSAKKKNEVEDEG